MDITRFLTRRNLIVAALVLILGLVTYLILTTPRYVAFTLHTTPYTTSNLSAIHGDSILSYSGMSFIRQDIKGEASPAVLNSGLRLPTIEKLFWGGNKGALITFTDGGYIDSVLEQELTSRGKEWDEDTRHYLWYLDFKTSKLSLVSEFPLMSENVAYDQSSGNLYYVRGNGYLPDSDVPNSVPLIAFSTTTLQETTLINTQSIKIGSVSLCENNLPCYSVNEDDGEVLYVVESGQKERVISEDFDKLIPTGDPWVLFGLRHAVLDDRVSEDEILKASVFRIDLKTSKIQDTTGVVGATNTLLANTATDDKFYVMQPTPGNSGDVPYLTGGKTVLGHYKVKEAVFKNSSKDEASSGSIIEPISRNGSGATMFHDVEGTVYLITPGSYSYGSKYLDSSKVEDAIKTCFDQYTKEHDYTDDLKQFRIGIDYGTNFRQSIRNFAECVNKTDTNVLTGYTFIFIGLDSSGRYVTD
ncbi:MAG TPA: hypothetical protein PLN95_00575 [Candidatus Saccharibacteria bacterium]|nr:hypothetical protein [Candidatus Saccharibacteria bacterium]